MYGILHITSFRLKNSISSKLRYTMTPVYENDFRFLSTHSTQLKTQKSPLKTPYQFRNDTDIRAHRYSVAKLFYPILLTMKLNASFPVKIIRTGKKIEFMEEPILSVSFLVTFLMGSFYGFLVGSWILNSIFGIWFPSLQM